MECLEKLSSNSAGADKCPRCSVNKKRTACTCEYAWDHYFDSIYSFFDFNEQIQHIVHHVKYKGKKSLAFYLGKEYAAFIPDSFFTEAQGVIPVPLHYFRKLKRGYNQAEYFAQGIIKGRKEPLPFLRQALIRTRHTKTQTQFTRNERKNNLSGAFSVPESKKGLISGKRLILIDDVITTGATADICSKVLMDAGAGSVKVISLARA
jgi:ComF family protein